MRLVRTADRCFAVRRACPRGPASMPTRGADREEIRSARAGHLVRAGARCLYRQDPARPRRRERELRSEGHGGGARRRQDRDHRGRRVQQGLRPGRHHRRDRNGAHQGDPRRRQGKDIPVVCVHIGGAERRKGLSVQFIELVAPAADQLVVSKDGNVDDYFSEVSQEDGNPADRDRAVARRRQDARFADRARLKCPPSPARLIVDARCRGILFAVTSCDDGSDGRHAGGRGSFGACW